MLGHIFIFLNFEFISFSKFKKNHFRYCLSETSPCTTSHNKSHNNKTRSHQASQNKPESPVRKLPSLLLTVLFSPHKPDCSLPAQLLPGQLQQRMAGPVVRFWVCGLPCSRQLGMQLSAGGTAGLCLPAGKGRGDQVLLIRA